MSPEPTETPKEAQPVAPVITPEVKGEISETRLAAIKALATMGAPYVEEIEGPLSEKEEDEIELMASKIEQVVVDNELITDALSNALGIDPEKITKEQLELIRNEDFIKAVAYWPYKTKRDKTKSESLERLIKLFKPEAEKEELDEVYTDIIKRVWNMADFMRRPEAEG